ncbi:mxaA protein [Methylophilaceae bacterium]|nr:mxaA protein [Methylophilaceae bacterium]
MPMRSPIISTNMWQPDLMKISLSSFRSYLNDCAVIGLGLILLSIGLSLRAEEKELPAIDEKQVTMHIAEPERDSGYTVGDLLTRVVTLELKKPYKLLDTSLPIVGYEKRYKGQIIGIELRDIRKQEKEESDSTVYTLHLTYQVFTRNVVAKPASLPPEFVKVKGEKDIYSLRIPSWNFRISPIAVFGEVKLETDMSPFRGPLLMDDSAERLALRIAAVIFALSALGLLYVLGAHAWLPRMGGPFARAYRDLKKLPHSDEGLKQAVTRVHQAFNLSAGNSVFADTLDQFLEKKPAFSAIRGEIEQFFNLSRQVFFEPKAAHQISGQPQEWLRKFSRRCRDCERGLSPGKQA